MLGCYLCASVGCVLVCVCRSVVCVGVLGHLCWCCVCRSVGACVEVLMYV